MRHRHNIATVAAIAVILLAGVALVIPANAAQRDQRTDEILLPVGTYWNGDRSAGFEVGRDGSFSLIVIAEDVIPIASVSVGDGSREGEIDPQIRFIPLDDAHLAKIRMRYLTLPAGTYTRGGDSEVFVEFEVGAGEIVQRISTPTYKGPWTSIRVEGKKVFFIKSP